MSLRGSSIAAVLLVATACAHDDARSAELSSQSEAAAPALPTSFTCTPSGAALSVIPAAPPAGPGIAIFRQVDAACSWDEPTQIVLQNESGSDIEISALGLDDPHFALAPIPLPHKLAAGDILPLQIDFSAELGSFNAKLSIEHSSGCTQLPVRAKGVEANKVGVAVHDPYVVSFGHVRAGTLSEPVTITVVDQPMSGAAQLKVAGFRASTPEFLIETQPTGTCESGKASVRLMAPAKPGVFRGQLTWTFEGGETAALVVTEMIAVVD
jgi:hypothetical protein